MEDAPRRANVQDYRNFPLYLTADLWNVLESTETTTSQLRKIELLCNYLVSSLGLRHASEPTQSVLVALVGRRMEALQQSALLQTIKSVLRTTCTRAKHSGTPLPGNVYLEQLPAGLDDLPEAFRTHVATLGISAVPAGWTWKKFGNRHAPHHCVAAISSWCCSKQCTDELRRVLHRFSACKSFSSSWPRRRPQWWLMLWSVPCSRVTRSCRCATCRFLHDRQKLGLRLRDQLAWSNWCSVLKHLVLLLLPCKWSVVRSQCWRWRMVQRKEGVRRRKAQLLWKTEWRRRRSRQGKFQRVRCLLQAAQCPTQHLRLRMVQLLRRLLLQRHQSPRLRFQAKLPRPSRVSRRHTTKRHCQIQGKEKEKALRNLWRDRLRWGRRRWKGLQLHKRRQRRKGSSCSLTGVPLAGDALGAVARVGLSVVSACSSVTCWRVALVEKCIICFVFASWL